jgi:phage tail-like protein
MGRDDWSRCAIGATTLHQLWDGSPPQSAALAWNDQRNELTLEPRLFKFTAAPKDTFPSVENRRGAGQDAFGNWYWIDETSRRLRVLSSGSNVTSDFWPVKAGCECREEPRVGDFRPRDAASTDAPLPLSGLAVTEDHYLVVGVLEPAGLLIFDLSSVGGPRQLLWPKSVPFAPFDMAPRPGGGVWILDRANHSYWALDRHFNVIGPEGSDALLTDATLDDFQPLDKSASHGTQSKTFPAGFSLLQSPLALVDPIAIEALPDGTVLILDFDPTERFSRIYRYRFGRQLPDEISTEVILKLIEPAHQSDFSLVAYDLAFVADRLYIVAADGNQSYAFRVCVRDEQIELQPISEYLPMRLFGGKALVGSATAAYYDFAETWIPLVKQNRPRYVPDATLVTPFFDGREPDCVWHRLMLDACIPPETKVEIWSRAANEPDEVKRAQWQAEPDLYLRSDGIELPFLRPIWSNGHGSGAGNGDVSKDGDGTWELLFQRARGRYVQLRLRLSGNERNTPRLRNLRAYYPRFSYLKNYLPNVYREDDQSASFLDRYLANVEGTYTTLEDKIAAVQVLFDVRSAPAAVLDWLANWFGVALDPTWDEARRRMFIKHAMDFFQFRGTRRGLTTALHLALDECPDETIFDLPGSPASQIGVAPRTQEIRIVEKYLTLTTLGVVFGDTSAASGPRVLQVGSTWEPTQGRESLNQRYASFTSAPQETAVFVQYPLIAPAATGAAASWSQFSQATLGFVPSTAAPERAAWQTFLSTRYATIALLNSAHQTSYAAFNQITLLRDQPKVAEALTDWQHFQLETSSAAANTRRLWHDFLARRYRRINALNQIYATKWTSFDLVSLPDQLPVDGAPLADWYQFEAVVMQMHRAAHRFTVLLPVPLSQRLSPEQQQDRLALAQRIIDLEKPAHTVFEVKFYWAMFRIGEARLQLDTVIDQGSRAPQLLPRVVLDRTFVGESFLATPALEDARDRYVLGRDPLGNTPN